MEEEKEMRGRGGCPAGTQCSTGGGKVLPLTLIQVQWSWLGSEEPSDP